MMLEIHIHPILVHFPIAFIYLAFSLDILSFLKKNDNNLFSMSYYLVLLTTLTAILSLLSGLFLTTQPEYGSVKQVFENHELWAILSVISLLLTTSLKTFILMKNNLSSSFKIISLIFSAVSLLLISYTGYLGGSLVYNYLIK